VDTNGKGVDAITPDGIMYGGKEYKVDCIVSLLFLLFFRSEG
jgi:hypothetical protein